MDFVIESVKLEKRMRQGRGVTRKDRQVKMFFFPKGEGIWENLENRRRRPWRDWKEMIPQVLELLRQQGTELKDIAFLYGEPTLRWGWSQGALCDCGCSPAFVLKAKSRYGEEDVFGTHDIDVSVKLV